MDENERNEMLSTCSFYRDTAIPRFIHSPGPYPLCHVDFGLHNTLVNEAGDVVGVIDWSNSHTCPWESFATFPLPISVVWTKRSKYPTEKWEQLLSDQAFFVQALKEYEKQFCTDATLSELIASPSVIAAEGFEALMYDQRQANRWSKIVRGLLDEELTHRLRLIIYTLKQTECLCSLLGPLSSHYPQTETFSSDVEH